MEKIKDIELNRKRCKAYLLQLISSFSGLFYNISTICIQKIPRNATAMTVKLKGHNSVIKSRNNTAPKNTPRYS